MIVQALVGIITVVALCGAAIVPVEEADIQLTASDADNGNWTANMGEMEVWYTLTTCHHNVNLHYLYYLNRQVVPSYHHFTFNQERLSTM